MYLGVVGGSAVVLEGACVALIDVESLIEVAGALIDDSSKICR